MQGKIKKVSIIIPCYNGENFIDKSISSIYYQDYDWIELIVVDDGSTDSSKEKILAWEERFLEKKFCLKYIYQENQGSGGAVNTALKYVTGEYLTLLDADDKFLPGSIGERAFFLDENDEYAGVRSNGWYVREDKRTLFIVDEEEKQIEDLFTALSFGETNNWSGTYMVRTNILFEIYPERTIFSSRYGQNFQILLPVAYKRKIGYIDKPLMEYYIQENSHSRNSDPEKNYLIWEQNSLGWKEIYFHIIDQIILESEEAEYYKNIYNSVYYRGGFNRAIKSKKSRDVKKYYKLLKSTGLATLNDKISYYSAEKSPYVILLKVLRRLKSI